jgi:hypothetical protein
MSLHLVGPRGRGLKSPASRYIRALLALSTLFAAACGTGEEKADNSVRRVAGNATADCTALPDTASEWASAQQDRNDLPVTVLILPAACPRVTIAYLGGPQIERTYRLNVPANYTLVARARGDSSSVTIAIDFPTEPKPDRSNVALMVQDSIRVAESRTVAVRVRLVPKIRVEPPTSRVLLTVLARPDK